LQKGWRKLATRDPQEEDFRGATYVGVPAGVKNDLIVFDLDFYKKDADGVPQPASNEVWDRLAAFEEELLAAYPGQVRVHETQSGGVHLIMLYPNGKKIARNPMPNMEVIMEGFQFIWPTEGSGYKVIEDVRFEDLAEPNERFLKIRHKAEGMSTGSGLMTPEKAHEVMLTDGEIGTRHDALLRITQDLVGELHDDHLRAMTDAQIGEHIQRHLESVYGHALSADRAEVLFEIRAERDGTLSGGELGRALAGPLKHRRAMLGDRFAALAAAKMGTMAKVKKTAEELYAEKASGAKSLFEVAAEKKAEAEEEDLQPLSKKRGEVSEELTPWLIEGFVRQGGSLSITGMSNVGKTTLSASLIASMLAGRTDLMGIGPVDHPLNVAWLNVEETSGDLFAHVSAAQHQHGLDEIGSLIVVGSEVVYSDAEPFGADIVYEAPDPATGRLTLQVNDSFVKRLVRDLEDNKIDILMMDPITEFNGGNEDKRYDARMLNRTLRRVAMQTGVASVYWAHTGKPPEGKRPDWYEDDLYAQRGSSQNTGQTDGTATLSPLLPVGGTSKDAWKAWKDGKEAGGRNLIKLKMVRIKKYPHLPTLCYEIVASDYDADLPVVLPISASEASDAIESDKASAARLAMIEMSRAFVKHLGEGRWKRTEVLAKMRDLLPAKDMRAKRHEAWLRQWKSGYQVEADTGTYVVRSVYDPKADGFEFDIAKVEK
jgi:hypothetical protein